MLDPRQIAPERVRPITRAELGRMVGIGMFEGERIELLEGVLVDMSPQRTAHAAAIRRLTELLLPPLVGRAYVRVQLPYAASQLSEPEPDVAVVPPIDDEREHPESALLVIEVADSSLEKDLGYKARLYARSRVDEYWVVDAIARRIVVHRDPEADGWRTVTSHDRGDTIAPARFPEVRIAVADVVP